jgi:hypothetical protein
MKTIESAKEKIRENLYSFYLNLGNKSGYKQGTVSSATYIFDQAMSWPSYILGGGKMAKNTLVEIYTRMQDGSLPYLWLRSMEDDPEFEDFAGKNGIRKINLWHGMYLKKTLPFNLLAPIYGLIFEEVKTQRDLREWLNVVNKEIITETELGIKTFLNVLHDPNYRFFRVTNGKKTLSTILMHQRDTETGIYMVSTIPNERGKGLGRWITACAMDLYISMGCKEFVLHATTPGYPVYMKLGFEECCKYGVFWMFGKK